MIKRLKPTVLVTDSHTVTALIKRLKSAFLVTDRLLQHCRTDLGNVLTYTMNQENNETQVLSTENCLYQLQEDRWITIKEEGSKEEDRQEEADVKIIVKNV